MALTKTKRLSGREIKEIIKRGKLFESDFFRIKFFPAPSTKVLSANKFAFIVGSRVSRKANQRNKIKRRVSEAIRLLSPTIKPGLILILVKPQALGKGFSYLRDDLNRVLGKIGQR